MQDAIADEAGLLAMAPNDYMSAAQLAFFRRRLEEERRQVEAHLDEIRGAIAASEQCSDEADRAAMEEELRLLLRQADRETKLLRKIAQALTRIDEGEYGYCQETGEPIGLPRLLLRPTAALCLEAKQRQECREHHFTKHRGQ